MRSRNQRGRCTRNSAQQDRYAAEGGLEWSDRNPLPDEAEALEQAYCGGMKINTHFGLRAGPISRRRRSLVIAAAILLEPVAMRLRGYRVGGNLVVRCREGHLFTTIWVPGASLKSIRLGWWRFQRCPVGKHWSIVTPVKESDLTEEEKRIAGENKDVRIP